MSLSRDTRIFIAGHRGLVGSSLWRYFKAHGFDRLIGRSSAELDLRDATATWDFFDDTRPDVVIDAAAVVGGIAANASRPAEFLADNLRIQVNLLECAVRAGVSRFLFLGSSCIYPASAAQPLREDALLTGPLEKTNEGYAVAKLAGIAHVGAIRSQYGLPYVSVMPTNMYGPGDNFSLSDGHVLPALIRRFHEAKHAGTSEVRCWGTGRPRREFLFVDDFAEACHRLLECYDDERPINIGTGHDLTIAELAALVADVVGFRGAISWDAGRPDGTYQKVLDVSRIHDLGWHAHTSLSDGIQTTYEWFLAHQETIRR
jgi:GDP-L-fucose synthase